MTPTRETVGTLCAAVLACAAVFPALSDALTTAPCVSVVWSDGVTTAAQWDGLLAGGWVSDPTDGIEALYSPSCFL